MVLRDLRIIGFDATLWYSAVQDRGGWYDTCQTFASRSVPAANDPVVVAGLFVCECGRMFRRQGDLTHHHNFCDRQPPVTGSFVCECGRMFKRRGDLIRHQNFCDILTIRNFCQSPLPPSPAMEFTCTCGQSFGTARRFDSPSELLLLLELFGTWTSSSRTLLLLRTSVCVC